MLLLISLIAVAAAQSCTYGGQTGSCKTQAQCGAGDWTSYRFGGGECRPLPAGIRCCTAKPTPVAPLPAGQVPCTHDGRSGVCSSTCAAPKEHNRWNAPNAGGECRTEPAGVLCCSDPPPAPISNPLTSSGPRCTYRGGSGSCIDYQECTGYDKGIKRVSIRSREGAIGCGHIKSAAVRCCVAPPPGTASPSLSVPAGRSCALARPGVGCHGFVGSTLTVNVKFVDEVMKAHAYARNAGASIHITSSFRPTGTTVGASRSRHKVGFAFDMNVAGCNSDCMCPYPNIRNSKAKDFLMRVVGDSTLHWGGNPRNPIWWKVGSCARDSVHIQSTKYEDGANYDSARSCLNKEYNARRFLSFDCTKAAALYDEEAYNSDILDGETEEETGGVSPAIIAVVVVGVLLLVAIVAVAIVVKRRQASAGYDEQATLDMTHDQGSQYQCSECGKGYDTTEELEAHVELRH